MDQKLDAGEVQKLWNEYLTSLSHEAREKLILNYLHLVKYVVGRVAVGLPSHITMEDMYSTGITGLVRAIEKYDPEKRNKFETYAILLIKGAIIDEMRALDWVPRSVHQKASQVGKVQRELEQKLGRPANDKEVAGALGISVNEYEELLTRIRPAILVPLDTEPQDDLESTTLAERIPDDRVKTSYQNADRNEFRKLLEKAVMELPEQERAVLVLYYYENLMLKEIGQLLGISESRVSQIHSKAVIRMKTRLQNFKKEYSI